MKILIVAKPDFRTISLFTPLKKIAEVGFTEDENIENINNWNADIIFSDSTIGYGVDIKNIKPFVNLETNSKSSVKEKYACDVVYLGNPLDFDQALLELRRNGHKVKVFFGSPCRYPIYSGTVSIEDNADIYASSKVCPIPANDTGFRELDIISAGGNPVVFKNKKQFIEDCKLGIAGEKFKTRISRAEIINNHTNYDRCAELLTKIGYRALSDKIMRIKNDSRIS